MGLKKNSMNLITEKINVAASPLLILFAFLLPLSTATGSIGGVLLLAAWLVSGNLEEKTNEIIHNPVAIAVLLYIGLHIVGLLWSEDLAWGLQILKKQWKLLIFPISLTIVKKEHINYYLMAFVAAITLKASKAYLVWLHIITLPPGSPFTTLGATHVTYNPMLAIAIYVISQNLLFSKNRSSYLWPQIALLFFLSGNMFITVGRTGQVAFFVLLGVILFQNFYTHSKKKLLFGLIFIPLLFGVIFSVNPTFRNRINTAITEIQNSDTKQITSMGCRMWFYQNTFKLLKNHWLVGTGTGDFPIEYKKVNDMCSPGMPATDNPHNHYLMITSQFGIIGLAILLSIFVAQLTMAFRKKDNLTPLRQAFPIFFLVIMLSESYLQVHGTGLLFSLFSSFLYKEL